MKESDNLRKAIESLEGEFELGMLLLYLFSRVVKMNQHLRLQYCLIAYP